MIKERRLQEVEEAFQEYLELLGEVGIEEGEVLPAELIEYFEGDTPTGDATTLKDVISNRWLFLHEIAEIKHLKLKGNTITRSLVWEKYEAVLEAHLAATALELKIALKHNDSDWVKARARLIPSWLEDPDMPEPLRKACETLLRHYSF